MRQSQLPRIEYDIVPFTGGLDQVTPTLQLKAGHCRDALNWEASVTGGYSRIAGYERFSGLAQPSDATYQAITVTTFIAFAPVGGLVTGAFSGATALIASEPGQTLILTKVTGTFVAGENLTYSAAPYATSISLGADFDITAELDAEYTAAAADVYRALIAAVPGSGPIRGVQYFNGLVYAWRDNAGATALDLYKSSASGWTAVSLGKQLSFTAGLAAGIVEGNTVTGATSGATGVVTRVVVQSGSFGAGTAAGRLIFASTTGTFSAAENLQVGGTNRATSSGAQSNITASPGGRVETLVANFGGTNNSRIYGADGINKAFEFDGSVYVPIVTGMATDTPLHIAFHRQHLFLSFGASVQFSAIGNAYVWSPVFGAGEIALNSNVTAFLPQPGDQTTAAMAVYSDDGTYMIYGTSSADFNLVPYSTATGSKAYSAQNVPAALVFSDRGVISLQASAAYGNFDAAALTLNIKKFIQSKRNLVTASGLSRERSQYRVFFSDGYALYMTLVNGQLRGSMPVYFPNPVTCMTEGKAPNGDETSYFGSTDGYVYRIDAGTSFDGDAIASVLFLVWNSLKNPRVVKRFRKAAAEMTGSGYAEFDFAYYLGYGSQELEQGATTGYANNLSPSAWDSFVWDTFYWDGRDLSPTEIELLGSAENIAMLIQSESAHYKPFTINSMILHYSHRRGLR